MFANHLPLKVKRNIEEIGGLVPMGKQRMTKRELAKTEKTLRTKLPATLRKLLCEFGMFSTRKSTRFIPIKAHPYIVTNDFGVFFGAHADGWRSLSRAIKVYARRVPPSLIPIAGNLVSDLICLGIRGKERGKVYFWDHENELDKDNYFATHRQAKSIPRKYQFQNVHLIARSFDDFLCRLRVLENAEVAVGSRRKPDKSKRTFGKPRRRRGRALGAPAES